MSNCWLDPKGSGATKSENKRSQQTHAGGSQKVPTTNDDRGANREVNVYGQHSTSKLPS